MNDLISRSALIEWFSPYMHEDEAIPPDVVIGDIKAAPTVDAVKVGNCEGCIWENRKRPQKCSCCRRNPDMKDCYEERKKE